MFFVLLAACQPPCPAARASLEEDEPVSGISALVLQDLLSEPFPAVALRWRDEQDTMATATLEMDPATARMSQAPYCVDSCVTFSRPSIACGPDELAVEAWGRVTTEDGRIDQPWRGEILASAVGGPVLWRTSPEPVPEDEVQGEIDLREVGEISERATDVELRVHLQGIDEGDFEVSMDILAHEFYGEDGEVEANSASLLASAPEET